MGYLETFNNSIEYNEQIGNNGLSIGPSVSIYEENNETKVKYVKRPSYKLTYDKSATKLFYTGFNIKRVWDKNGIILENNNPLTDIEVVVNENDIVFNDAGTAYSYVNPNIMLSPVYAETIEISLDNDNILESDGFAILGYQNYQYGVFGGLVSQLSFGEGYGLINGKVFFQADFLNDVNLDAVSFYIQRNDKILKTIIKFMGVDSKSEIEADRDADGIPVIPNIYTNYLSIESDVELDDVNNGLYLFMYDSNGEEMVDITPIGFWKEMGAQFFDNKKMIIPVNGLLVTDGIHAKICLCHITWENNEPMTSIIDYTLIKETTVKIGVTLNAAKLTKTSDTDFTIKYEPYNRFREVSLQDTNVSNIYDSLENVTQINTALFSNCKFLTKLVIPNTVTKIGMNGDLFKNCDKLEYVELPDSITDIERLHFNGLPSLKTIVCYAQVKQSHIFHTSNVLEGGVIKVPFGNDTSCWSEFVNNRNWTIEYI